MPPNTFENQQAASDLLQGLNTMQMQAGFMPGAMPGNRMQPTLAAVPTPSDFSNNLRVQFNAPGWQMPLPPQMGMGGVTPIARPYNPWFGPQLPGPTLGSGYNMARQSAVASNNSLLTGIAGATSFGANLGGGFVAGALGTALGGPLGGIAAMGAYDYLGVGDAVGSIARLPFQPMLNQRQRALQLQQASLGFVNRGPQLSASGMGLSMGASMQLERSLMGMADDSQFQRDTENRFNRTDVMKITRLAGQFGMLSDAQSADTIKRSVGQISRALSNFMKLAEEPDVQRAMAQLASMRNMGMTMGETSVAMQNARAFSRMAGVSVSALTNQAMAVGAPYAQSMGMTGGAGMQMHMAAQGAAGMMASSLDPRSIALMGGREGMANNLFQMNMQATNIDALLPAAVTMQGGQLRIDPEKLRNLVSGRVGLNQALQQSVRSVGKMGMTGLQDLLAKDKGALRDELTRMLGPQAGALAMYTRAAQYADQTGMTVSAAARVLGADEQGARMMHEIGRNPNFFDGMRRQLMQQQEIQRRQAQESQRANESSAFWHSAAQSVGISRGDLMGIRQFKQRGANLYNQFMQREFGDEQDIEEQIAAQGGGALLGYVRGSRLDTDIQRASMRDRLSKGALGSTDYSRIADEAFATESQRERGRAAKITANLLTGNVIGAGINMLTGRNGFGVTEVGRGGRDISASLDLTLAEDIMTAGGRALTDTEKRKRFTAQRRTGTTISRARQMSIATRMQQQDILQRNLSQQGVDSDQLDAALGIAASEYNKYLGERYNMFRENDPVREEEYKARIEKRLVAQGFNADQVRKIMSSQQFLEQAVAAARDSQTDKERSVEDQQQRYFSEAEGALSTLSTSALTEQADEARKTALRAYGVNTIEATESEQRQLLNIISPVLGSQQGDIMKEMLRIKALKANKDTQAAVKAEAALRKKVKEKGLNYAELATKFEASVEGVSKDTLMRMGQNYAGRSEADMEAARKTAEGAMQRAGGRQLEVGLRSLLGEEGRAAFEGQDAVAKLGELARTGGVTGIADAQLLEDLKNERLSKQQIQERAFNVTPEGTFARVVGGVSDAFTKTMSWIDDINESATARAKKEDQARGGVGGENFGSAVNQFDSASRMLLQAAEMIVSQGEVNVLDYTTSENYNPRN